MIYDVAVIGAGVIGALAARELTRYKLDVCIIEKEADAACGASGANTGIIHAGYDPEPGTLKAELGMKGAEAFPKLAAELDIPYKVIGSLLLAFKDKDTEMLRLLYERGLCNGVRSMSIVTAAELRVIEPAVSTEAIAGLYAPSATITSPYEYNFAALENAVANGAVLYRDHCVTAISNNGNVNGNCGYFDIMCATGGNGDMQTQTQTQTQTTHGRNAGEPPYRTISARYVVNAAGLYSDVISAFAGYDGFVIKPRRGQYVLMDKAKRSSLGHVIFPMPTNEGKGIVVTPTIDGNMLIGPSAEYITAKDDTATTADGVGFIIERALMSVPGLDFKGSIITAFSGIRAQSVSNDFVIGPIPGYHKFINAAGIDSPGLSAAPAIAARIIDHLDHAGLPLIPKKVFNPIRKAFPRFGDMGYEELAAAFSANKSYGRLVCRCEKVSEAEIIDAIRRPGGAITLDGIKLCTRAGMGRCQGGFCTPAVMEIMARELGIPVNKVTKSGIGSEIIFDQLK